MEQTPLTNTNLIHVKKVRERIARIRSLGMEISPAMETIILKETEIAFNEGKRTALDAVEKEIKKYKCGEHKRVLSIINTIKG